MGTLFLFPLHARTYASPKDAEQEKAGDDNDIEEDCLGYGEVYALERGAWEVGHPLN